MAMFWILLVLAASAVASVFYFRLRRLRQAARMAPRPARNLPVGVEISCAEFNAMMADMEPGPMGDGLDAMGRPFAIYRYRSRQTGRRYDYIAGAGGPRVIQYPAPPDSRESVARLGEAP